MFRFLLSGLILASTIVGVQLYLGQSKSQDKPDLGGANDQPRGKSTALTFSQPASGSPSAANPSNPAPGWTGETADNFNETPVSANQPAQSAAWQPQEDPPSTPARYQRKGIDVRALNIDAQAIAGMDRGDAISLPIPQTGESFDMRVEQVGKHVNGDRSLRGHLLNTEEPYAVVMTQGATSTFATINTPTGSYMLEANGNQGWIMALADLDQLIDPNLNDFQIPNITR